MMMMMGVMENPRMVSNFSHLNQKDEVYMVNVGEKQSTRRTAMAGG